MKKGFFITIDGPDGSGKSTQAGGLSRHLRKKGYEVARTFEPGGTATGVKLRKLLLDPASVISPTAELLLYEASRAQLVAEFIKPALSQGKVVLCERFYDATCAYQGWGRGIDAGLINKLNLIATGGLVPDLTILLDIETGRALKRAIKAKKEYGAGIADRLEMEDIRFHERVRRGFLAMAKKQPRRIKMVKVKGSIRETQDEIRRVVDLFIPISKKP